MNTILFSLAGLHFQYSENPFDDAHSRITNFKGKLNILTSEQLYCLYEELQILIDKIFNFQPSHNINFSKSSQEKYLYRSQKLFEMFFELKNKIDIDESMELHDIYDDLTNKNYFPNSDENLRDFLKIIEKTYQNIKQEKFAQKTQRENKEIKQSPLFKAAVKFADKNGIYCLIRNEEFLKKDGTPNATALSVHLFGDKSCRSTIGYTLNKDYDKIDEKIDIHNKTKNIYFSLKQNHILNKELFLHLKNNYIEIHPLFTEKLMAYNIEIKN